MLQAPPWSCVCCKGSGSTLVQGRGGRDFGVPGRRALPSRWASPLGGDGDRRSFFSCREKGQEKESASQRGQEKTPLGSCVSTPIPEHPTQKSGKNKYQAGRVGVGSSHPTWLWGRCLAVCSPVGVRVSPQHSAQGSPGSWGSVQEGICFPGTAPLGSDTQELPWHPNFSLHQLCPEVTEALHWCE